MYDLAIVGAGPAGLSAAINGASEGLRVAIFDSHVELGGQARESAMVENYPLPFANHKGVTGHELTMGFIAQAEKFKADIFAPAPATALARLDAGGFAVSSNGSDVRARSILLAPGLTWRRLLVPGLARFMGRCVFYGAPPRIDGGRVAVIGGANSAGQAAVRFSRTCKHVMLVCRSPIEDGMSSYLVERLKEAPNVKIVRGTIRSVEGGRKLTGLLVDPYEKPFPVDKICIFIGGVPNTGWLPAGFTDDKGFILTDDGHQTIWPGVFAAGDARAGQTVKRITGAVFDGVAAIMNVHQYLTRGE